jgi:4-hydroxyphenylpyruvate dioxygenase
MATNDIQRAISQVVARGARLLHIPGNYYEDIEARWGLEPARLEMLLAHNILYDRDDGSEFLHAYTEPFNDLFFEVVQRIGDYQQYGAANASVRMAAQAKRRRSVSQV